MKTWKLALIYGACIIALAMIIGAFGCNTVKKSSSSSKVEIDSSHVESEVHENSGQIDSSAHTSESGDYTKETVIEEFSGGNLAGNEFLADSTIVHPDPPRVIKRTTIKETGNYLKDQTVQVAKKDTGTVIKVSGTDLNKTVTEKASDKQTSRFPWAGIVFGVGVLLLIGIIIFTIKKYFL